MDEIEMVWKVVMSKLLKFKSLVKVISTYNISVNELGKYMLMVRSTQKELQSMHSFKGA